MIEGPPDPTRPGRRFPTRINRETAAGAGSVRSEAGSGLLSGGILANSATVHFFFFVAPGLPEPRPCTNDPASCAWSVEYTPLRAVGKSEPLTI